MNSYENFIFQVLQYLQKSQRCLTQELHWEKSVDKCKNVGEQSLELADCKFSYLIQINRDIKRNS